MGCLFTYPTLLFTLFTLWVLSYLTELSYESLFATAVLLLAACIGRKIIIGESIGKRAHIAFRMLLGVSLALAMMSILLATNSSIRLLLGVVTLMTAISYNVYNGFRTMRICKECAQYPLFPRCDGSKEFRRRGV